MCCCLFVRHNSLLICILLTYFEFIICLHHRVIVKVDSGPGRTNIEMLAYLRVVGIYCVPGVPNTTHVSQETDQSYGLFKTVFRINLETLSQARFDRKKTLQVHDLPLLVFGGEDDITKIKLQNTFDRAFCVDANLNCWKKCGAVPLTRRALLSDHVRHQVVVEEDGTIDLETDPKAQLLIQLENENKVCCSMLDRKGFDGLQFRINAPNVVKQKTLAVTRPQTKERLEAIVEAKSAGGIFHATGGEHLNSDDYFKSRALIKRRKEIEEFEKKKKEIEDQVQSLNAKDLLLSEKGIEFTRENATRQFKVAEIKIMVKSKVRKIPPGNKNFLIDTYFNSPDPEEIVPWSEEQENMLSTLKREIIDMKDTALAVSTNQMARGITNNITLLNTPEKEMLRNKLNEE